MLKIEAGKFVAVIDGEKGPTCLARTRYWVIDSDDLKSAWRL